MAGPIDYEVKVIVNAADVLNSEGMPNDTLHGRVAIGDSKNVKMQFLDTRDRDLHQNGLFVRLRAFDGDDPKDEKVQITYKKRFDVNGNDIDGAVAGADLGQFNDNYEPQIEWGLEQKVLTVSRKKDGPDREIPLELPGKKKSRKHAIDELPSRFNELFPGGVEDALKDSHVYGPVEGVRWKGSLDGVEVDIEVWQIKRTPDTPPEPLVEISTKTEDRGVAEQLQILLQDRFGDVLSGEQTNKTRLVLENHPPED
jgi:hypothetical protein